ncbi:MAG TPA: DUF3300 domain-containing protein [Stellaceae bacterium]|nr:DUF3300 domain-containing protein [Stellaceae bacterium]
MRASLNRVLAAALVLALAAPASAGAQNDIPPPPPGQAPPPPPAGSAPSESAAPDSGPSVQSSATFSPQQLEQMLAPIALYPDDLLGQILMAATYPLEVVEAARWLQDPGNAALRGDQLAAAVEQQPWDPSVKSLMPFPQVVRMMDARLGWMQQLGDAFIAQQADVMDAVQRLRQQAQAAGRLAAIPHEVATNDGPDIAIQPADPGMLYVPIYNPADVYGPWPYPDYPPLYFPPPAGYAMVDGIGFGIGVPIIAVFWGWDHWDWRHHHLDVDRDGGGRRRDGDRAQNAGTTWQHDPTHRRGVPYHDAATRAQFQRSNVAAAPQAHRDFRGFDNAARPVQTAGAPRSTQAAAVPRSPQAAVQQRAAIPPQLPTAPHEVAAPQSRPRVAYPQSRYAAPNAAPAFNSAARGVDVRTEAARGFASRQTMAAPARAPAPGQRAAAPAPSRGAPSGGRGSEHR